MKRIELKNDGFVVIGNAREIKSLTNKIRAGKVHDNCEVFYHMSHCGQPKINPQRKYLLDFSEDGTVYVKSGDFLITLMECGELVWRK